MERLFKGHQLSVTWDDDYNGFIVKCINTSTSSIVFIYADYDSIDRYEAMHIAKKKLDRLLKS
jgi:hypothetical protein